MATEIKLIIDQGNSFAKIAIFDRDKLVVTDTLETLTLSKVQELKDAYQAQRSIVSSVRTVSEEVLSFLENETIRCIVLNPNTRLPIKNDYRTPHTLGQDRIAAVVGAHHLSQGEASLVIDAGTAITYDLIDHRGVYLGGNIAPGVRMRLRALNEYTERLPLISSKGDVLDWGKDTETAIRSGVIQGIIYEINGYIKSARRDFPSLNVYLTGGNIHHFENKLDYSAISNRHLVLWGLNKILDYNV